MEIASLSVPEAFRFASVVAISMVQLFAGVCSYLFERRNDRLPMFALIFLLLAWCTLTLGASTSGLGRYFPFILVGAPFLSGYIGPALYLYTRSLTTPHERVSLKWLCFGGFGTIHTCLALILPDGLDPAIQSIIYQKTYFHPILGTLMLIHGVQLITFIIISTFLITRCYVWKNNPDLRRTQFWLLTICWTSLVVIVFTNILPIR